MAFALAADDHKQLERPLSAALAALCLHADTEQRDRLLRYVSLLKRWNAIHNLSATRDASELLQHHVIDCLAIVPSLTRHARGRPLAALDAGTGAGLPAVVIAIMLPTWEVAAVDAVGKKVAFLRQAGGELGLRNLHPQHIRLESMAIAGHGFDVVTARAFSSLAEFVRRTGHLIDPSGIWMAMKGKLPETEIRDLPADCQLFHVERLTVPGLGAERCLVWIKPARQNAPQ